MGAFKAGAGALPYRDINIHAAPDSYTFSSPSSPDAPVLVVDRPSGDLRLSESALLHGKRVTRVSSIAGILGLIHLRLGKHASSCAQPLGDMSLTVSPCISDKYVIIITKAQQVGRLQGHMVYRVVATEFLPLRERQIRDPDEDGFLTRLRDFIRTSPLYFSYSLDLTNSFQRQAALHDPVTTPMWKAADDRFFWNRFVMSDLIDFRTRGGRGHPGQQPAVDPFILPVIFGIVAIRPTSLRGTSLTLALVSRRSRFRGGTRYLSRGIDEQGHASNYNETEQVLIVNDTGGSGMGGFAATSDMRSGSAGAREMQVLSYVQTRGSVPVYWAEINDLHYVPRLQVRSIEAAFPAARTHFAEQVRIYGDNYLVNLVNKSGRERRVKEAYEKMVSMLVSHPVEAVRADRPRTDEEFHLISSSSSETLMDRIHYVYFDFHSETKGLRLHRAQLLLDQLRDALDAQGYFRGVEAPALAGGAVRSRLEVRATQTSVVRTNCMDCLDRTNVVQSLLGRDSLNRQLVDLRILPPGETFTTADPAFELLFRNLWADNADAVSSAYAGTGAMKTDMTRMGIRTRSGALRDAQVAITRYCRNNFMDGPRQDAFDLFLGAYRPDSSLVGSQGGIFVDTRPALIQAVPYLLGFAILMVFLGLFSPRMPDAAVLPLRVFTLVWLVVAAWSFGFVWRNGMLYVSLSPFHMSFPFFSLYRAFPTVALATTVSSVNKMRQSATVPRRHALPAGVDVG